jgi:hypothetical protein
LSELISILLGGSTDLRVTMKKGAACKLECSTPIAGHAALRWLLTSRHLAQMA